MSYTQQEKGGVRARESGWFGRSHGWLRVAAFVLALAPLAATAAPLDLSLRGFYDPNRAPAERTFHASYGLLMSEVALALGSRMSGPAQSMGALGVEAAYELSLVQTNADADYWKSSVAKPSSVVNTGQLRVRKGLPYGIQTGCVLTHMMDSNMWALGAEVTFSLIDGFTNVPDLALRTSFATMIGHPDISMPMFGGDLVLSKSFAIAGLLALQPWAAYSFQFSHVTTRQIEVYPNDTTLEPDLMLLKAVTNISHRATFGVRVVVTRISIGAEFLRSFTDGLSVFTGKVGLDF